MRVEQFHRGKLRSNCRRKLRGSQPLSTSIRNGDIECNSRLYNIGEPHLSNNRTRIIWHADSCQGRAKRRSDLVRVILSLVVVLRSRSHLVVLRRLVDDMRKRGRLPALHHVINWLQLGSPCKPWCSRDRQRLQPLYERYERLLRSV